MDTTAEYIAMCTATPELWDLVQNRIGTPFAWGSLNGILVPRSKERQMLDSPISDLYYFLPEFACLMRWGTDTEDLLVTATGQDYPGEEPDIGTPLYRQDQLQAMVLGRVSKLAPHVSDLHALFFHFRAFVQRGDEDTWWAFRDEFSSMEQLWLAFVMHELYQKRWNGGAWVKETVK